MALTGLFNRRSRNLVLARALVPVWLVLTCLPALAEADHDGSQTSAGARAIELRYQRANELQAIDQWLLNQRVLPHWIGQTDAFWYRRQTDTGHEFQVVDATRAKKTAAFEHSKLALTLSSHTGRKIDPAELPLKELSLSDDLRVAEFTALDNRWRYNIQDDQLAKIPEAERRNPTWLISPDGSKAVYNRDYQIWLRDLHSGDERQLTFDGEQHFAYGVAASVWRQPQSKPEALWSPDSSRLVVIQTDERQVLELPLIDYVPADGSQRPTASAVRVALPGDRNITRYRISVIDTSSGKQVAPHYPALASVRMNDTPISGNRVWWSHDSNIAWFADIHRGEQKVELIEFDTSTGDTRRLFAETVDSGYIELASSVYMPASIAVLPARSQLVWYSERSGWAHFYLYDLKSGELIRPLTKGSWQVRDLLGVDERTGELFFTLAGREPDRNPYYRQVARLNLETAKLDVLSGSDADHFVPHENDYELALFSSMSDLELDGVSGISPTGKYYVETIQRADRPARTLLRDRNGREVMPVEEPESAQAPDFFQWPEPVELTAADGRTAIQALLLYPGDFSPDKSYPIVDHVYGGPQVSWVPENMTSISAAAAASVAELGFFVAIIDGRGSAERNRAFHEHSYGAIEKANDLADHVAAIRQLAKLHPQIDTDRVGVFGFSGGGYQAAHAMMRYPEFYKVGIAASGNHDQRLFWQSWGERYQGALESENYVEQANQTHAEGLRGDLLLIHGLQDFGVHPAMLFSLTQALIEHNKDFELVLLPQTGHTLPGYGMRRQWDFLLSNLAGLTPPDGFVVKSRSDNIREELVSKMSRAAAPEEGDVSGGAEEVTVVVLATELGDIEIEVFSQQAPNSARSFLHVVEEGLLDGTHFYRTVRSDNDHGKPPIEVIQGGLVEAPASLDTASHETTDMTGLRHLDGTVSLARLDPGTANGALFFISIGTQPSLDFGGTRNPDRLGFAAFGRVVSGMDIVQRIHQMRSDGETQDAYLQGQILSEPVRIERAYRK